MKKVLSVFALTILLTACNEESAAINGKLDSLENELDTLGNKIENKAEQVWDSTKVKAGDLKDKAEQLDSVRVDRKDNDSINKQ
jgi:hypothetical protein